MRPVTDSFLETVRGAHTAVFRARLLEPGLNGVDPGPKNSDGTPQNELQIVSGFVRFDTTADVNGTVDITVFADWPDSDDDLLTPYGNEIYVERGVQYGNGVREWVGLGYFRIDTIEQARAPKGAIRITGSDRTAVIRDGRSLIPIVFGPGNSIGTIIDNAVMEVLPDAVIEYDFDAYSVIPGNTYIMSEDRLKFIQEIVEAYGRIMYFDYRGVLVIKVAPVATVDNENTVWNVNHGENGVLVSMRRSLTRDSVYNAVKATGEPVAEGDPVVGYAYDLDPASPTYWFGDFGKVPRFFSSDFLQTVIQCDDAAAAILRKALGIPYLVELGVVPNPALEGWDIIQVDYDYESYPELHQIDVIEYSMSVTGPMHIQTRKQIVEL